MRSGGKTELKSSSALHGLPELPLGLPQRGGQETCSSNLKSVVYYFGLVIHGGCMELGMSVIGPQGLMFLAITNIHSSFGVNYARSFLHMNLP